MPRFLFDPSKVKGREVVLGPGESRHGIRVMRLKPGDAVELMDGKGNNFSGFVTRLQKGVLSVALGENILAPGLGGPEIALGVSVIKPEPMDLVIQKSCELGARSLYPMITERCVVRMARERWISKAQRWRRIALESCKQCGRAVAPAIAEVSDFKSLLKERLKDYELALIPTLAKAGQGLYDVSKGVMPGRVIVFVGPEGDFTREEAEEAIGRGVKPVSLGPLVMRSETAALYVLSVLQFLFREVRGAEAAS